MILNFTLTQFINFNIYLGYSKKYTISSSFNYLIGNRKKINIFNLVIIIQLYKQLYNYLSVFLLNFGTIWFIGDKEYFLQWKNFNLENLEIKYRLFFWNVKWQKGVLSNYKYVKLILNDLLKNIKKFLYPNCLFVIKTLNKKEIYNEIKLLPIYLIQVTDTKDYFNHNYLSIFGNEKSWKSFNLYYYLLFYFIKRIYILKKIYFLK